MQRAVSYPQRLARSLVTAAVLVALSGCEAPLNLEGVAQEQAKPVRRTDQFQALASNDNTLVAVGTDGLVLRRDRSASTWQRQQVVGSPGFIDVASCTDQSFAALSLESEVWLSRDQGQNWQRTAFDSEENMLALACAPDNSLWAVGSFSTIASSRDGGQSWNAQSLNEDAVLTDIQFLSKDAALVTGEFGTLAISQDSGHSWEVAEYIPDEFYPQGGYFRDRHNGWVAGLNGTILHTADGGRSWQSQPTGTESPLYGFHASGQRLFAFGDHGTLLELNGQRWAALDAPKIPVYLRDAESLGDNQLLVAGGWGALFTVDLNQ
ncbi:WD40/YVTN/BNR-like repeat-containing protein [Marinobacterium jannaschii]|uniref:WD40/YVTN/BNR-like repeat-containing protein n=1 Tax=Marinobacterium jannaschii TaxID=64970 RepID=UPI00068798D6|nr:YCF48-related protein [Marinobacterium jannaschii]